MTEPNYLKFSRAQLLSEIETLKAQLRTSEEKANDHQFVVENLSLHQEELRMQNEQLKESRQNLEAVRQKYIDLYEFAPIGYITLSDKCLITELNQTFANLIGRDRQQIHNQSFLGFVAEKDRGLVALIPQRARSGKCPAIDVKLKTEGREDVWVQLIAGYRDENAASKGVVMVALVDISAKIKAETELEEANLYLQKTIDNLPTTIAIIDELGVIKRVNQAWRAFAAVNDLKDQNCGLGVNYLELCRGTVGSGAEEAHQVAQG
ncbi:MAG: PAS domain-containing protein, partial [Deltaproteobacteria bacterium]|nr:PAS domain-containing protein [Deltaproteobacteria bacterium]